MSPRRFLLVGAILMILTPIAHAKKWGIAGFSGRSGMDCTACHGGGHDPTVWFNGPSAVPPNWAVSYEFYINGGQLSFGGLDIAASGGLLGGGTNTYVLNAEIAQSRHPAANQQGNVIYDFIWTAPPVPGMETLWGAGVSANGNASATGDGTDTAIHGVEVRELAFHAYPSIAPVGRLASLRTFGGVPGAPVLLVVVEANGVPTNVNLALGTFDASGNWLVASQVPSPAAGFTVKLMSFGFAAFSGTLKPTNIESLVFPP